MATNERELVEAIDLCEPTGRRLNPGARGWSRVPLHRANLAGRWGRTKRWDYWAILAGDRVIGVTYAHLDYLGLVDVFWANLPTGVSGGRPAAVPFARGFRLPEVSGEAPIRFRSKSLQLDLETDAHEGTRIRAVWTERGGERGVLDATIDLPRDHESLNVVIPWSDDTFQFTSKHQARPAHGELAVGRDVYRFGLRDGGAEAAFGVLDVGRGRWPYSTRWNWGGGAGYGRSAGDARVVGLQLGGKWTEGTGFTENGFFVDGKLFKVGDELVWRYDFDHPLRPWRVRAPDGSIDVVLEPRYDRHSRFEVGVLGTHVHQVFGQWSGSVVTDEGERVDFKELQGFAEECRSRW